MRRHLIDLRRDCRDSRRRIRSAHRRSRAAGPRRGRAALRPRRHPRSRRAVGGVPVRVVINDLNESNMSVVGGGRVEGMTTAIASAAPAASSSPTAAATPSPPPPTARTNWSIAIPSATTFPSPSPGRGARLTRTCRSTSALEASQPCSSPTATRDRCAPCGAGATSLQPARGDFVCHWGESSHYSCATVELTDYAPPGELCGGPCEPTWVTVTGLLQ